MGDMRATIVLEHVIQASDVSHTMQHWHIYQKWNKRLFFEMRKAFRSGRMPKDPSEFWYNGELGFFDNYVIPLAKKLKDCGVFGVSSYEYLDYAEQNRAEWEERGKEIIKGFEVEFDNADVEWEKTIALVYEQAMVRRRPNNQACAFVRSQSFSNILFVSWKTKSKN